MFIYIYIYIFVPFRVIKSRRLGWVGHVARMEERRNAFKIITGKLTGKRPLGRTILEWTLER